MAPPVPFQSLPFQPARAPLGISAIAIHRPAWELDNGWFGDTLPRKFTHHTGIETRRISLDDEVTMGFEAVRALRRETGCDLARCRGIAFVSPSLLPAAVARRSLDPARAADERPIRAARRLARMLGVRDCHTTGLNWFCCGYSRALDLVHRRWAPRLALAADEFLVVVVATRISRITDYSCAQTAGLFGDLASATLLAPSTSRRHPVHFEIVHSLVEKLPVEKPTFDFHVRRDLPLPAPGGGRDVAPERLVYALEGMAIAEVAPRAMSAAIGDSLRAAGLGGGDVDFVVPHQAGAGIVRFLGMQLETHGIRGELVNGLTRHTGNVSACSVPHALRETWDRLRGLVACPTVGVGRPGRPEILRGCVLLRTTPHHERSPVVAA